MQANDKQNISLNNLKPTTRNRLRKSSTCKQTNLDYILSVIGSFGLYQKLQFILVGFLAVVPSMVAYSYVFVAATPNFKCILAQEKQILELPNSYFSSSLFDNETELVTEKVKLIRILDKTDKTQLNKSKMVFDNLCQLPFSSSSNSLNNNINRNSLNNNNNNSKLILKCLEWLYDESIYGPTIVSEWNLVCLKSHLKAVTQNSYIIGTACAILTGILSDKLGRKTAIMLMVTLMAFVLNITQLIMHQTSSVFTITQKFIIFTISRFFQGFAQTMYTISFILLTEITGPKHRVLAGNILAYSFSIGQIVLVSVAYYLKDWRKLMWFLAIYIMPFFLYYWLIPESPRWLLSKDKIREAKSVLKKISRINRTYNSTINSLIKRINKKGDKQEKKLKDIKEEDEELESINEEESIYIYSLLQEEANKIQETKKLNYTETFLGILRSKLLRRRSFILFYIWMIILMVYLGMGMGMSNAMDKFMNPYLIFLIQSIAELLGIATCQLVLNRFGRKYPLIIFMMLSSVVIILIPAYYKKLPIASFIFYLIAKYSISAAQLTCTIFTTELYPTPMRGTGVGLSATISRLGGVWAPQINVLSSTLGFPVPYFLFSLFTLIAGFLGFFLPETLNRSLPENVNEAEKLEKQQSFKRNN